MSPSSSSRNQASQAEAPIGFILTLILLVLLAIGWVFLRALNSLTPPDLSRVPNQAWLFLSFCLGIAGLTTATVQIIRTLLPIRGGYHWQRLEDRWTVIAKLWNAPPPIKTSTPNTPAPASLASPTAQAGDSAATAAKSELEPPQPNAELFQLLGLASTVSIDAKIALREFERRGRSTPKADPKTTPDDSSPKENPIWLYDLPIEQLSGQLYLALDAALDDAPRYPHLLLSAFDPSAREILVQALKALPSATPAQTSSSDFAHSDPAALAQSTARATLLRSAQFEVDSIQIALGGAWRRGLRLWVVSVSIGMSFLFAIASWFGGGGFWHGLSMVLYAPFEGLVAGYLAMVLRDLIAIVELKRRSA